MRIDILAVPESEVFVIGECRERKHQNRQEDTV